MFNPHPNFSAILCETCVLATCTLRFEIAAIFLQLRDFLGRWDVQLQHHVLVSCCRESLVDFVSSVCMPCGVPISGQCAWLCAYVSTYCHAWDGRGACHRGFLTKIKQFCALSFQRLLASRRVILVPFKAILFAQMVDAVRPRELKRPSHMKVWQISWWKPSDNLEPYTRSILPP